MTAGAWLLKTCQFRKHSYRRRRPWIQFWWLSHRGNVAENGGGSTSEDLEKMMEIERVNEDEDGVVQAEAKAKEAALGVVPSPVGGNHKGLARKVLPDVIGLLNSRLWNLWDPNV
ncbi:hypothetical protein Ancab_019166 [Ancistrocladus abbreviatus]